MPLYNTMTEILFADSNGDFPQAKKFNQTKKLGGFAIGAFREPSTDYRGTGFVFMLCSGVSSVVALILTAARVFVKSFRYESVSLDFVIGDDTYEAFPLKSNLNWLDPTSRYYDPITNCPISIPEDWVVCELKQKPGNSYHSKLVSLSLSDPTQPIYPGLKTRLVGFPKNFNIDSLHYVSPEADVSQYNKVKQCFLGGNKLIVSKGEIMSYHDMICTTCVSANGMSGSPLLIKLNDCYKVIGLLHGGPATPIHYYTSQIISNKLNPSNTDFDGLINYIQIKRGQAVTREVQNSLEYGLHFVFYIQQNVYQKGLTNNCANILCDLYSEAINYEFVTGNQLKYNLCVPIIKLYNEALYIGSRYV
ncbi:hypothetical protein SteCoe_4683 [Stentor coeruleus]|uniref:Peptidase S1 domain-containing protein n=1 Tax=Stentor coeruleus TaxID=5963 RepID=A0A1R2CU66_9CILI|nr:hypothetical protein SteCoe_4683 [Stentor coeruleus]